MTGEQLERPTGHVFISYVREDVERVNRLAKILEDAGIRVWRDTDDLWPGQDWRLEIRSAIKKGAFAFLACFSRNSENKAVTYQNEELNLAVEQIRVRPPGHSWLIPVRFDGCRVPDFDLGAGRTLDSLQRVDLLDSSWEKSGRLIAAIVTILSANQVLTRQNTTPVVTSVPSVGAQMRTMLLDPSKEIEVEDLVNETIAAARDSLTDDAFFPTESQTLNDPAAGGVFIAQQIENYSVVLSATIEILMCGAAYGKSWHEGLWARVIQRLATTADNPKDGQVVLLSLRKLPLCLAVYAASVGAVHRHNWGALRAVTTDAQLKTYRGAEPIIALAHPWLPFEDHPELANLAIDDAERRARGEEKPLASAVNNRRLTPASDYLYGKLRPLFTKTFSVDDVEYSEVFDRAEVYLGLIAERESQLAKAEGRYQRGSWYGSFIWRDRHSSSPIEKRVVDELAQAGNNWPPLQAGLFGGKLHDAQSAAEAYLSSMTAARERVW